MSHHWKIGIIACALLAWPCCANSADAPSGPAPAAAASMQPAEKASPAAMASETSAVKRAEAAATAAADKKVPGAAQESEVKAPAKLATEKAVAQPGSAGNEGSKQAESKKARAEDKQPAAKAAKKQPVKPKRVYVPADVPAQELKAVSVRRSMRDFIRNHARRFIVLRQSEATYAINVPVSYRIEPSKIKAHIVFTNSNALLKGRSQMRLRWNGGVFAQAPLDPSFPDGMIDVTVPLELVTSGQNQFTIDVSQHYLSECEDPGSPELWTMVDMEASYIELEGKMRPVQPTLRSFDNLLSSLDWSDLHVTMVPLSKSPEHLHAGTLLAESLANRAGEQHVIIDSAELGQTVGSTAIGHDLVVFGTYEEAEAMLGPIEPKGGARGHILVRARQNDPGHFLLAVLGKTKQDVVKAASAFAWATLPLSDEATMDVFDVQVPSAMAYSSRHAVQEGREYNFADLGFHTTTLKGLQDAATVTLWLPPDLFAKTHAQVEMRLHFSYGAALRPDSVLNVYHNGQFLRGISLSDPRGLLVRDYRIWIPLHAFRPGLNEFRFESRMRANTGTNCTTGNTDNLLMTLFDDSTFTIPETSHYVAMPDLNYLVNTGYPYLGDLGDTPVIQIPNLKPHMLASAWTLAAKLGQLKGSPIQSLTVSNTDMGATNVIRMDVFSNIDDRIWEAAPVHLGRKGFVNHPSLANPSVLGHDPLTWRKKLNMLLEGSEYESGVEGPRYHSVGIQQSFSLKNQGVMMQFENPRVDNGTMTLLVSDSQEQLVDAIHSLIRLWPQMQDSHGDLLLWGTAIEQGRPDFWSAEVGSHTYHIGSMPFLERITYFAIQYPVFLLIVLFIVFVFMAILTRALLIMYRHQVHPHIEP